MKYPALFLLAVAVSLGCSIICGCQRPPDGAEVLHRKYFEAGRRSESKGDVKIAGDSYDYLIKCGSFYGEYGLAMLLLRREPGSREAVNHLLSCAQRTSDMSDLFPVSVEESAFSVAAMAKLSDIAVADHDRSDVAASLRGKMSGIVTAEVRKWAKEMKADTDSAMIYGDVISAVESTRQSREYAKPIDWTEIRKMFKNSDADNAQNGGGQALQQRSPYSPYKVVKFNKVPGATCQYDFEVRLTGNGTIKTTTEKVRSEIRSQLVKEFLSANGYQGVDDVRTSFPSWQQSESSIKGSVVAFKMSVVRLEYNAPARCGKIAVRLDARDMKAAKEWVRKNIEELVSEKNVELVVGKSPPPGAHYETGSERMTEDGLFEVEFNARE